MRDLKTGSSTEQLQKGLLMLNPHMQRAVFDVRCGAWCHSAPPNAINIHLHQQLRLWQPLRDINNSSIPSFCLLHFLTGTGFCLVLFSVHRAACLGVEQQQLSCLQPGQPLDLAAFAEQHSARLQQAQEQLSRVYAAAVATAKAAGEKALAAVQQQLLGVAAGAAADAGIARWVFAVPCASVLADCRLAFLFPAHTAWAPQWASKWTCLIHIHQMVYASLLGRACSMDLSIELATNQHTRQAAHTNSSWIPCHHVAVFVLQCPAFIPGRPGAGAASSGAGRQQQQRLKRSCRSGVGCDAGAAAERIVCHAGSQAC